MSPNAATQTTASAERRKHRRLDVRLPVECRRDNGDHPLVVRTLTENVSAGGLYLELDSQDFAPGEQLGATMTIPPAEGVSPYAGRIACQAEVIRVDHPAPSPKTKSRRYGVAVRFLDRLRIDYPL